MAAFERHKLFLIRCISRLAELFRKRSSSLRNNSEIGRLVRHTAWLSIAVVLSQIITVIAYMLLARLIGKERFGEFTIIQSTANTVSSFAGLGLGLSATKLVAEFRDRDPSRAGSIFTLICLLTVVWTGILALIVWIFAPEIATQLLGRGELVDAVRIGAVLLFFTTILNVQNGALAGFESFDATAKTSMLRGFLILPFLLAGAAVKEVDGAIFGFAAAGAIICAINFELLRRRCRLYSMKLSLRDALTMLPKLVEFSVPAFLTNILPAPCLWFAQMLLIRQPDGYGELAIFTAAFQLRTGIILLPNLLSQPLVPMLASHSKRTTASRATLMRAASLATLVVAIGLALIVCAFPKYLMMAYGRSFAGDTVAVTLLSVSAVACSGSGPFAAAITSSGKMWRLFLAYAVWGIAFLATTCLLLRAMHGAALAAAYVVADITQAVIIFTAYRHSERELEASSQISLSPII